MILQKLQGKLFQMSCDPEINNNTIRIEIEINDIDFNAIIKRWIETNEIEVDLRI